jgi:hypothetical protein
MTARKRLSEELHDIMKTFGPKELSDQELADMVALLRPIRDRLTPANVIHLKPRAVRNRKQPARV